MQNIIQYCTGGTGDSGFSGFSGFTGHSGFTVRIKDLEIYAYHGVNSYEQEMGQIFLLDIMMRTPEYIRVGENEEGKGSCTGDEAIEADSIKNTVNYSYVCRHVTKWMRENTCQLIETAADSLCREILVNFPVVDYVSVEVKKPHAPMKETHFQYVSVRREMGWHTAYLSLGSNSADREEKMREAAGKIRSLDGVGEVRVSKTRSYPAVGDGYEGIFLNNAIKIRTFLSPEKLHAACREIEKNLGRRRESEGGMRPIDIDMLLYDSLVCSGEDFTIPYPDLHNRLYVLEPMCEISPRLRHPILGSTMKELLKNLKA